MVIASTRFAHQQAMILESVLVQPSLSDFTVLLCSRGEKRDDVPLVMPLVKRLERILKWRASRHSLRLFVGHIFCDGPIDVDQIIFGLPLAVGEMRSSLVRRAQAGGCDLEFAMKAAKLSSASMSS